MNIQIVGHLVSEIILYVQRGIRGVRNAQKTRRSPESDEINEKYSNRADDTSLLRED